MNKDREPKAGCVNGLRWIAAGGLGFWMASGANFWVTARTVEAVQRATGRSELAMFSGFLAFLTISTVNLTLVYVVAPEEGRRAMFTGKR